MFSKNTDDDLSSLAAKIKNALDIWIAFLTRNELMDPANLPKELNNDSLKKALNVLGVMNFSEVEKQAYEEHLKWLMTEAETLKKAKEEGREEGREEEIKKAAINMLKEKVDVRLISKVTGYTLEEVLRLKNEL